MMRLFPKERSDLNFFCCKEKKVSKNDYWTVTRVISSFLERVEQSSLARILIAEDEESLGELYKVLLAKFGHKVLAVVKSGDEAIEYYEKASPKPDIVILDHRLERMSGIDALKGILRLDPGARVIFASADDSIMEDAIEAGAMDYIGKPFSMQELVEVISQCLG
jgi:two-component system chemotaxis response regulator CheY